uniref:orotidine-5'-phosphate decarboxylase n=1 Tax=Anaerosporobacter sp. TaxID=1872529 RepID=UPI002F3F1563
MQRICELRIQLGYTQEFLGHLVGCDRRNISRYESGLREPDKETLVRLANVLHTTTDYLLNLSDVPHKSKTPWDSLHRDEFRGLYPQEVEKLARAAMLLKSKRRQKGGTTMSFDILISKIMETKNPTVMGLDPKLDFIPDYLKEAAYQEHGKTLEGAADAVLRFNKELIDSVYDIIPAIKPQAAYYEKYGWQGVRTLAETISYAKSKGMFVIVDGKRGDIGSTMEAYADGWLGTTEVEGNSFTPFGGDALTVNGYLGTDCIEPLIKVCQKQNKGIFVLAKTSNPSSVELQDSKINDKTVYETMASLCEQWGEALPGKYGYTGVGAVIGATYPEQLKELRQKYPKLF